MPVRTHAAVESCTLVVDSRVVGPIPTAHVTAHAAVESCTLVVDSRVVVPIPTAHVTAHAAVESCTKWNYENKQGKVIVAYVDAKNRGKVY